MPAIISCMAFSFDSQTGICALLLFAAALFAWMRAPVRRLSMRLNLRFAAVLLAAAAFAAVLAPGLFGVALAVAVLVASLASAALALCTFGNFARPPPPLAASLGLSLGLILGLVAALSGQPAFALGGIILSGAVMIALALGRLSHRPLETGETIFAGLALICGGMALMENVLAPSLLFFAAGLGGVACASQPRVEQQAAIGFVHPIGRARL
jgi:hypothetical protein